MAQIKLHYEPMSGHIFTMGGHSGTQTSDPGSAQQRPALNVYVSQMGGGGSSCPAPFKREAPHSCHLWHDWLHMTSADRHVCAIRNALLAAQSDASCPYRRPRRAEREPEEEEVTDWTETSAAAVYASFRCYDGLA